MKLSEKTRCLILAHLKSGRKPREIADLLEEASYSQVLKLKKDLDMAEDKNALSELFNLDEAAIEILIDTVKTTLQVPAEILAPAEISNIVNTLETKVSALSNLEEDFQGAASELVKQIKISAITSSETATLVQLAEALSKLQSAFFAKGTQVQVNNINGEQFEKYLRD